MQNTFYQNENDGQHAVPLVAQDAGAHPAQHAIFNPFANRISITEEEWMSVFFKSMIAYNLDWIVDEESSLFNALHLSWKENNEVSERLVSDWALRLFNKHYGQNEVASPVCYAGSRELREEFLIDIPPTNSIGKQDIFCYVYAVWHDPVYRAHNEEHLQSGLSRIPLYERFYNWQSWGRRLMDIHLNIEHIAPFAAERKEVAHKKTPKTKLIALPEKGIIQLDENTELHGIPETVWLFRPGNLSALEWMLNQYKQRAGSNQSAGSGANPNLYGFADDKEEKIVLLEKMCTVSIETVKLMEEMKRR